MPDLPRPVQVLHDGRWVDGDLEAVRRTEGGWRGLVRYVVDPGRRYLQWHPQGELRAPLVRPQPPSTATTDDTHDSKTPGQSGYTPPDLHREHP